MRDIEDVAYRSGIRHCSPLTHRGQQRYQKCLLTTGAVHIGERTVVFVPALPDESHRLRCVDLLNTFMEVGAGELIDRVVVEADRDRLHGLGDLKERGERHFDEVIDLHTQEFTHRVNLGLTPRLPRRLFAGGQIFGTGSIGAAVRLGVQRLLVGKSIGLLDLALAH
ncbi:Uncharacterised protein [Mycobacteroides abscessus subsp. abscessus]|nr:Uncharacterised protein [Mycobacteroides abscessus subsp. abscessus]SKW23204.1 Uncharacterised protein [Mycobacteroides abscessus subsp. abscessus]